MRAIVLGLAATILVAPCLDAKLDEAKRRALVRELAAEFGTAKMLIPRSKQPLDITSDGKIDPEIWAEELNKNGPAARMGDMVQITKVEFKGRRLVLELNHGISGGRKWWHRVQVSGSTRRNTTLGQNADTHAPGGTELALVFEEEVPDKTAKEFLAMLTKFLDFEQRSATELYMEKLEPEVRTAIEKHEVLVGMDRDMVLMSKDRPNRKVRDFKDGIETEDWIYGEPPGEVIFVTFQDGVVIKVDYAHANLGGQVSEHKPVERD